MRAWRPWLLVGSCVGALVLLVPPAGAAPPTGGLSERSRTQIEALAAAKAARTPAQAKVDSTLLTAADVSRGRATAGLHLPSPVKVDGSGRTRVTVRGDLTSAVLDKIMSVGGTVRDARLGDGAVSADVPVAAVPSLADLSEVRQVTSLASDFVTTDLARPGAQLAARTDKAARARRLRERLAAAVPGTTQDRGATRSAATGSTGSVVSEGDKAHGADRARAGRGLSGIGITVGVLSDGVDSLAASVASKDLPPDVRVLAAGSGDEGTAMLEIVHDVAPKAKLAFATANDTPEDFAQHIRDLRAAGADVIVDDILYFGESPFQDGPIAQAVADVTRDGALYFSSAGNEGNVDDGTSGNYEGTFRSSGRTIGKAAGTAHDFDPGAGVQEVDPTTSSTADVPAILQWADPLGRAKDDYDLYALDPAGNVVAFSNNIQDGDDDPFEGFFLPGLESSLHLAVVKFTGADVYFQLTAFRGRFAADGALEAYVSPGVTRGHSTVPGANSVAAVPAHGPLPLELETGDPANPAGPYPDRFTPAQRTERFTSDGPRRMFFTASGAPYTPGDVTATGGGLRSNPDLTAADGVRTATPGFDPFYGTSAAAPHAAALAALALSGRPDLAPSAVQTAMYATATDIEVRGRDRDTGVGIVMAEPLAGALHAQAQAFAVASTPVVTSSTDGDAYLEPGERGVVVVRVTNQGDARAKDVQVRLQTSTSGVTVTPATQPYGDIVAGASGTRSFTVAVPRSQVLGSKVRLSSRVSFTSPFSPQTLVGDLVVGQPSTRTTSVSYAGSPVSIPDGNPAGASVKLAVSGVGRVSKVTLSLDGATCSADPDSTTVGLNHSFVGDLVGRLTSPAGTSITLFDRDGGPGRNFCRTLFASSGTQPISAASPDQAPFTGTWRPEQSLTALNGTNGDGTWTFTVVDTAQVDSGTLRKVSLHVNGFEPAPG